MTRLVILSTQGALEFFRTALDGAMARERVAVGPFTELYLANLLLAQMQAGVHPDDTLADRFARALVAARTERVRLLREVGDTALVTCGLWADRELHPRHPMDARYQADMGRRAYARLSRMDGSGMDVFGELADRFNGLVDALIRLGTEHSLSTARDILRLYEQWQKTHSRHAARALADRGIAVVPGDGGGNAN